MLRHFSFPKDSSASTASELPAPGANELGNKHPSKLHIWRARHPEHNARRKNFKNRHALGNLYAIQLEFELTMYQLSSLLDVVKSVGGSSKCAASVLVLRMSET
jgi:hypothetical protein